MYFLQLGIGHVRVDLGRTEILVAEHFLHGPEIRAVSQQIRREGMSKRVRRRIRDDPGFERVLLHEPIDRVTAESEFLPGRQCRVGLLVIADEEGKEVIETALEVGPERLRRTVAHEDDPDLSSLSPHADLPRPEVEVLAT